MKIPLFSIVQSCRSHHKGIFIIEQLITIMLFIVLFSLMVIWITSTYLTHMEMQKKLFNLMHYTALVEFFSREIRTMPNLVAIKNGGTLLTYKIMNGDSVSWSVQDGTLFRTVTGINDHGDSFFQKDSMYDNVLSVFFSLQSDHNEQWRTIMVTIQIIHNPTLLFFKAHHYGGAIS